MIPRLGRTKRALITASLAFKIELETQSSASSFLGVSLGSRPSWYVF